MTMMRTEIFASGALLACLAAMLGACNTYTSDLLPKQGDVTGTGGSSGSGGASGDPEFALCGGTRAQAPPPPDSSKIRNRQKSLTCTMVQRKLDLGDREPNPADPPTAFLNIGLDVDNKCTTAENLNHGECQLPAWSSGAIDGPGGIDNTLGAIVQGTRNAVGDFSSDNYSAALENGGITVMYRITGYNGELDDDQVRADTYVAANFDSYSNADGGVKPAWDGQDVWPITSESIEDPPADPGYWTDPYEHPKFYDPNAYVTGGKLVATLTDADLRLQIGLSSLGSINLDLRLSGATLVCDMEPTDKGCGFVATRCTLAGRWAADHLLHQLSQFPDPAPPQGRPFGSAVCTDSPLYTNFKSNICSSIDVYSGVAVSESVICDALSMGVYWDTEPALMGDIFYMDPILPRCDDNIEPSRDSCDPSLAAPDLIFSGSSGSADGG